MTIKSKLVLDHGITGRSIVRPDILRPSATRGCRERRHEPHRTCRGSKARQTGFVPLKVIGLPLKLRLSCSSVGFNTEVRKALDDQLAIQHRFGALCSAVQRFSPNGFNATLSNLRQAVRVTDPGNWTPDQIAQAADLLTKSRVRCMHHRARWDEGRRNRKALGLHCPSSEEFDALGDRSWFDSISYSPKNRYGLRSTRTSTSANWLGCSPVSV